MTDVAEIAGRLTRNQRRAILAAHGEGAHDEQLFLPVYRDRGKLVQSIYEMGLASIVMRGVMLNGTGLAVRAHLQEQE